MIEGKPEASVLKLRFFPIGLAIGIAEMAGPTHDEFIGFSPFMLKDPPMIIVSEVAPRLKTFLEATGAWPSARTMMMRMVLAFMLHSGRMSCSQAVGVIASDTVHRGELTRLLARRRLQKHDFNGPRRRMLPRSPHAARSCSSSMPR